jgi:HAD superfamily hydrolase (TIGR01549 family)
LIIKLAIFDMDGTVFESHLDWKSIRKELNLENQNILKAIYPSSGGVEVEKLRILEKHEKENTRITHPIPGIENFLSDLKSRSIKLGLITNNNKSNTEYLLNKFGIVFDMVITRELKLWKPDPAAFLMIMKQYRVSEPETMAIGDSIYDIEASRHAKIPNIFIKMNKYLDKHPQPDVIYFTDYKELLPFIKSLDR